MNKTSKSPEPAQGALRRSAITGLAVARAGALHFKRKLRTRAALQTHHEEPPFQNLRQAYVALGILDPCVSLRDFIEVVVPAAKPMQDWMLEPLRHEVFDFSGLASAPVPNSKSQKVLARIMAGVPKELLSFDRAWVGTFHILRRLGARVHTAQALQYIKP